MSLISYNVYYLNNFGVECIERNVWAEDESEAIDQLKLDIPDAEVLELVVS